MGGDGSMAIMLDQLTADSDLIAENLHQVAFVPLPFGTGNDISRSLGWGDFEKNQEWFKSLDAVIHYVCSENYDTFTIWEVEIFGEAYTSIPPSEKNGN